jgi:hypothetical protein
MSAVSEAWSLSMCGAGMYQPSPIYCWMAENAEHTNGPESQPPSVDAAHFSGWYLNLK